MNEKTVVEYIFKLLANDNNWKPNAVYLFTIACLFSFLNSANFSFKDNQIRHNITDFKHVPEEKYIRFIFDKFNKYMPNIFYDIKKTNDKQMDKAEESIN